MDGATVRSGRAGSIRGFLTAGALALLLTGCGAAPAAQETSAPAPVPSAAPSVVHPAAPQTTAPPTTVPQAAPAGTTLLWPVTDLAAAQNLQDRVDGGAQPWLLDPEEVAISYATTTYGWTAPETSSTVPGSVDLSDPSGGTAHLTLVQPVRAGSTGIWVVSAATRG
ncbi:hypothetical protein ACL02T_01990 [Pseudonocardia sp. RS010]|uniref:hypothetical protein n=1 Tax=Pseudonocardia sp. RS010 TaxID=3385979 RepID=UPI0039A3AC39